MRKYCLYVLGAAVCAIGQTRIDLRSQTRLPDFSAMSSTRPAQIGAELPPVCGTGELYFLTTAPVGQNLYGCALTNVWTLLSGSMGSCTVDANSNVTCPGDLETGDGSSAGEMRLFEQAVGGSAFIAWKSPVDVTASYKLQLPESSPAEGQSLQFGAATNGVAGGRWVKFATKVLDSIPYPAAQSNGTGGWLPGAGWTVRPDGTGPQISGLTGGALDLGYLLYPDSATRMAGLHTMLPDNWAGGTVTAKLIWGAPGATLGQTLVLDVATACVGDGQTLVWPLFNGAQRVSVPVPYGADVNLRRATAIISPLNVTGCSAGNTLLLQVSRNSSDTLRGGMRLWGVELSFWKTLE